MLFARDTTGLAHHVLNQPSARLNLVLVNDVPKTVPESITAYHSYPNAIIDPLEKAVWQHIIYHHNTMETAGKALETSLLKDGRGLH